MLCFGGLSHRPIFGTHLARSRLKDLFPCGTTYLNYWQDDEELRRKVRKLKHQAGYLSAPRVLPPVEPIGN